MRPPTAIVRCCIFDKTDTGRRTCDETLHEGARSKSWALATAVCEGERSDTRRTAAALSVPEGTAERVDAHAPAVTLARA